MDTLNKGTKEIASVLLTDRLDSVTSIASADFKVVTEDETTVVDWAAVENIDGMRVDCLLDTTTWNEGIYKLYVRPSVPPEQPIIGPFEFGVS